MHMQYDLAVCEQTPENLLIAETNLIINWHDHQISRLRDKIEKCQHEIEALELEKRSHAKKIERLVNG